MPFSADHAEVLGLKALSWLASSDELLPVFLGSSGASISDLRDRVNDPEGAACPRHSVVSAALGVRWQWAGTLDVGYWHPSKASALAPSLCHDRP